MAESCICFEQYGGKIYKMVSPGSHTLGAVNQIIHPY